MPNAIDTLRELIANEPEAGRNAQADEDWCVDCGEWVAEHGHKVEALLQAADFYVGNSIITGDGVMHYLDDYHALAAAVRKVKGEGA